MIVTKSKCKYCGRDIDVFQKTEEEAIYNCMLRHLPIETRKNHPNFKVVGEGDDLIVVDTNNNELFFKTNKEAFTHHPTFKSLLNTKHVRHSCCINCGWVGEYNNLKIIEVVDRERDQCSFGCPNCNYVFHNYILMGPEAKEGVTLDKLGYELDLYRQ